MKISCTNSFSFTGRIIDSHVHSGKWSDNGVIRDYSNDIDVFIKQPLDNGDTIDKMIISNLDCMQKRQGIENIEFISDEIKGNKDLLNFANGNPKIIPLATCQPGYGSSENIDWLFRNYPNKFYGLKFHPESLNIAADDRVYDSYMEIAEKRHLPCLFHSGQTIDIGYPDGHIAPATEYAKPEMIYNLAKRHKNVPVIMAHMGGNDIENSRIAVDKIVSSIRNNDAKLYADISWVDCDSVEKPGIIEAIKRLKKETNGLERLLFGTDAPLGRFGGNGENGISPKQIYSQTVENIKNAIRNEFGSESEQIIDKIFYKNAENLFSLQKPHRSGGKVLGAFLAALMLFGVGTGISSAQNNNTHNNHSQKEITKHVNTLG